MRRPTLRSGLKNLRVCDITIGTLSQGGRGETPAARPFFLQSREEFDECVLFGLTGSNSNEGDVWDEHKAE